VRRGYLRIWLNWKGSGGGLKISEQKSRKRVLISDHEDRI
jgi:hypothetical protein